MTCTGPELIWENDEAPLGFFRSILIIYRIGFLRKPALFIHGNADQVLYPKNTRLLYQNKPGKKRLWTPEGVGHVAGFEEKPGEYEEKVVDFFDSHL